MFKKVLSHTLLCVMALGLLCIPAVASDAAPASSTVLVNGVNVAFDAYLIDDNNYFKLRDVAYTLSGTSKQFEVGYDNSTNAITLTSGKMYTAIGGEMTGKGGGVKIPTPTDSKIIKDGVAVELTAYHIDGNNYFKLRDIGAAFDFGVDWDEAKNTIVIDTNKGYSIAAADQNKVPQDFTNGFAPADYLKMNSPASENGLGGTKVYLECVLDKTTLLETGESTFIVGYLTDKENHQWMALLNSTVFANEKEYDSAIGKPIIFCGNYSGFSETEKLPVVELNQLCVKETGEVKSGIRKLISGVDTEEPGKTPNQNKEPGKQNEPQENDLSSAPLIEKYLREKYSSVETKMGAWEFQITVHENKDKRFSEDYTIYFQYDLGQMLDLTLLNDYTEAQRNEIKQQLKSFMKTVADDLLSKIKDKKIQGCYYYSYYRYPNLKIDFIVHKYCSWANFEWAGSYEEAVASTFRWEPKSDDEEW